MTLLDLLPPSTGMTDAELKQLALILSPELAATLEQIQAGLGGRRHMVIPTALTDGTFALCADLLSEIHPSGWYHAGFAAIPPALFADVQVISWPAATALLPVEGGP